MKFQWLLLWRALEHCTSWKIQPWFTEFVICNLSESSTILAILQSFIFLFSAAIRIIDYLQIKKSGQKFKFWWMSIMSASFLKAAGMSAKFTYDSTRKNYHLGHVWLMASTKYINFGLKMPRFKFKMTTFTWFINGHSHAPMITIMKSHKSTHTHIIFAHTLCLV